MRQVTHWDMDYLSKEEIEALYDQEKEPSPPDPPDSAHRPNSRLALVLMLVGVLLFLLSIGSAAYL